jgi:glycosyltransferase involved in cell wall biosynthesis
MDITFLTGEYPPMQGGIADHTYYLAQHLASLGVNSAILISRRWEHLEDTSNRSDTPVYPVIQKWNWRCWPAVDDHLTRHHPDVLHIQYQAAAFDLGGWVNWLPWYLRRKKSNTKIVTTFHDLRVPYVFPKAGRLRWQSVLALARHSHAVICTNQEDMHRLSQISRAWFPGPHLTHIPLGSNVEPRPPADFDRTAWRAAYGVNHETLLLAYFGFLNESKGAEELIEAIARLKQQGIDTHLLLIGGDIGHADPSNVAYAQKVERLIRELGLSEVIHRTGYVLGAEVSANLLAADAVVMPYRDGLSFRRTTLISAFRHGCPVVSTYPTTPSFYPEIQPGENILLSEPHNAVSLTTTIAQLHKTPGLKQTLSAGAQQLGNMFEWNEIAGQTAALYQTLSY